MNLSALFSPGKTVAASSCERRIKAPILTENFQSESMPSRQSIGAPLTALS